MKKFNFAQLLSLVLVCVMLVSMFSTLAFAEDTATEPEVEIFSNNVLYGGTQRLMYAIKADEGAEFELTVTDANGKSIAVSPYIKDGETSNYTEINSASKGTAMCYLYVTDSGVAAQNMADEVTATVSVGGEVVDTTVYSLLEYAYERLYVSSNSTETEKEMYASLIEYANLADQFYNGATAEESVANYKYVNLINCTADYEGDAVFAKGTTLTGFATDLKAGAGMVLVYEITNLDDDSTTRITPDDMKANGYTVGANVSIAVVETEDVSEKVPELLATFTFGANGTASHYDGSEATSYSESNNGYKFSYSGASKVYSGARDAKGNSCLKLGTGTSTAIGTFTVDSNVTSVVIYVAKYKANNSKITVNGTSYTLAKNSDDGQYDQIIVDTTSNKTISFATVSSNQRCMINTIEFIGYAK